MELLADAFGDCQKTRWNQTVFVGEVRGKRKKRVDGFDLFLYSDISQKWDLVLYVFFCEDSDFCILDIQGLYDILHSYLNFHLQFCLHKIKSYDNLRCLQCLRRHQQKLSTFSSQLIFISLLKLFPWILKASRKKNEHFPARLIVSVDPPLWLAFCVGVLLTWYYDYMCSETDFTQEKVNFHATSGIPNSSSYCCSSG